MWRSTAHAGLQGLGAACTRRRRAPPAARSCSRHRGASAHKLLRARVQGEEVAVAGRVMARRVMGKLAFVRLEDGSGSVQLYVDRATLDAAQPGGFRRGAAAARRGPACLVGVVAGVPEGSGAARPPRARPAWRGAAWGVPGAA